MGSGIGHVKSRLLNVKLHYASACLREVLIWGSWKDNGLIVTDGLSEVFIGRLEWPLVSIRESQFNRI